MNRTFKVWASVSSTPPSPCELDFRSSEALTHFACAPSLPRLVKEDEKRPFLWGNLELENTFFCKKRKSQKERGGKEKRKKTTTTTTNMGL